jgi:hypothetical protein
MPMIDIHVTRGTFQGVHQRPIEAAAVAKGVEGCEPASRVDQDPASILDHAWTQ